MPRNRHHDALAQGCPLHWYRTESVLGQGGLGITNLATDSNLGQQVAITEFPPLELAVRALTRLVTLGDAPFEQYNTTRENDRQGPWADIYSLAVTPVSRAGLLAP